MSSVDVSNWNIDHIGIAVKDLEKGAQFYLSLPGAQRGAADILKEQCVKVLFVDGLGTSLEFIEPMPGNETLNRFFDRRGEGLHHICYRVTSVALELERLRQQGVPLIDQLPRRGARGHQVAFLHPKASNSGVLIELCSDV